MGWRSALAARLALGGCVLGCGDAGAQQPADFYAAKTITLIVGTPSGGSYDVTARLISRHIGRFLVGTPSIIVRNQPGASSIVAAQTVYNISPRDGTTIAMFQATFVNEKINDRALKFEPERFTWIGRIEDNTLIGFLWHKSAVQSIADAKHKQAILGAIGSSGTAATIPWALNALIGTRFKVVPGYASGGAINLAIERGEVDGLGSQSWETLETKREWIENKQIRFIYAIALTRVRQLPDVPTVGELAVNELDRKALDLIASSSTIGRSLLAPPEIPAERTAELRRAFDAMVKDAEFLKDGREHRLGTNPLSGDALQKLIAEVTSAPADVIAKMQTVTRQP